MARVEKTRRYVAGIRKPVVEPLLRDQGRSTPKAGGRRFWRGITVTRTAERPFQFEQLPQGERADGWRRASIRRSRRVGGGGLALLTAAAAAYLPTPAAHAGVPSLREQAAKSGMLIGSGSINPKYLDEPAFANTLASQFNSLSPENELKWSNVEPQRGVFDLAPIDRLVKFARQHDMVVKGHGFVSGGFNPAWLTQITDPDELRAVALNHFKTIMDRYGPIMDRYDVVTEPFSTFGGTGLTQDYWYNTLGPDYIAQLFEIAHEVRPKAKLFINESLVESYPAKEKELYALVSDLVARGVP